MQCQVRRTRRAQLVLLVLLIALTALTACDPSGAPPPTATPGAPTRPRPGGEPTATAAPTPLPASELLAQARAHRAVGAYDRAAEALHTLLQAHPAAPEARAALFYQAESFALRRRWASAATAFEAFLREHASDDDLTARALFWLARSHEEAGAWADAAATYEQYTALGTPAAAYARLRTAALRQALGQAAEAASLYEEVAAGTIARSERAGAYEKAIALRRQIGDQARALELYERLLALASQPDYRARILGEAAGLAQTLSAADQARAWLREIPEVAPASPQALDAVVQLAGDPQGGIDPATAARVLDLHGRHDQALPYLDAAIAAATGDDALELRRMRALTQRALGDYEAALAELATVGSASPDSEPGRQAQLDWIQTLGQSGDRPAAIESYRQYAAAYPDDPRAPEALARAATLLTWAGDTAGAAQQQLELGRRYPTSEQGRTALNAAAWYFFNSGQVEAAHQAWELLAEHTEGAVAARAAYWAARVAPAEEQARLLEAAIEAAPESYYGARAAEHLGREPNPQITIGAAIEEATWQAGEAWVAGWAAPDDTAGVSGEDVANAPHVLQAIALGELNLQREALIEWNEARDLWAEEPLRLYYLARIAHEQQVPYIALKAAAQVVERAPEASRPAPEALVRLLYPTPYAGVLIEQAQEFGLDPRELYAMLRQESLFNPSATSWAGAMGLAQVMPATAQGIAQNLQVSDFQQHDLYRPALSIRFGAFYLSRQKAMMNGSLQGALAAYNGGPGNAQRWAGGTVVSDPDLFVESIDYPETRLYVQLVYGYYGVYQSLYRWP